MPMTNTAQNTTAAPPASASPTTENATSASPQVQQNDPAPIPAQPAQATQPGQAGQ
jgi:hypothetical protein